MIFKRLTQTIFNSFWLLFSLLLPGLAYGQQTGITDGPYVFYQGDRTVVKSVHKQGNTYAADSTSFSMADQQNHLLSVHLDGHPEWDFTVKLKSGNIPRGCVFAGASKTLILSDIEGEFEPFRNLLLAAKVIDVHYNWTFGDGKLVVAGDLFDRGKQVCQFLWLLYKLEGEARAKGGDVNVVLGNHDIMNLQGDFRYVEPEYDANAKLMGQTYRDLYAGNTELGQWLRSKNIIEKIGDLLVLHGGISPEILSRRLSLTDLNDETRPYYATAYSDVPDSLKDFINEKALFWYRGYFLEPKASQGMVDSTLTLYGCKKIVVGHDIIDHVAAFYNNEVIGEDVDEHEGTHEALLIDEGKYYRIDDKGNKALMIN
jgi:Calcineurin-like phosphoesterase